MKHYGRYLEEVGRIVCSKSEDIERKYFEYERMKLRLKNLELDIKSMERDFYEYVLRDWTEEEIKSAKEKANLYNKQKKQ